MGWNPFKKKVAVIDLVDLEKKGVVARAKEVDRLKKLEGRQQSEILDLTKINTSSESSSPLGFLSSFAESASTTESQQTVSQSLSSFVDDNKSKIAKRILGMTEKMEAQEKEIYSLQQRIELLERKLERFKNLNS